MAIAPAEDAFFIVPFAPLVYAIRANYTPEFLDYFPIVLGTQQIPHYAQRSLGWLGGKSLSLSGYRKETPLTEGPYSHPVGNPLR